MDSFHYEGVAIPIIDEPRANSGPVDHTDFAGNAISQNTGSLPIWGVAASFVSDLRSPVDHIDYGEGFAGGVSTVTLVFIKTLPTKLFYKCYKLVISRLKVL